MDFRTIIRLSFQPFKGVFFSFFSHENSKSSHHKSKYIRNFSFFRSPTPECPIKFSTFIPNSNSSNEPSIFTTFSDENRYLLDDDPSKTISKNESCNTFSFLVGSSCWPYHHPERGLIKPTETCNSYGVGDDAFLTTCNLLAVADGVGGWSSVPGADASVYSRSLLHAVYHFLFKRDMSNITDIEPVKLIYESVDKACTKIGHILGSSTLSIALLLRDDLLCLFNLGDSGIILVREGKCIFRSSPQCYQHNTPYQLGPQSRTKPSDGVIKLISPKLGDIILLATDGLFDNIEQAEIINKLAIISNNITSGFIRQNQIDNLLADSCAKLVSEARANFSVTRTTKKPIISSRRFQDGKPDDITVLLGIVIDQSLSNKCI